MSKTTSTTSPSLDWLSELGEFGPRLDELRPIWVRHVSVRSSQPIPPPHRHPYCEFGLLLEGAVLQFAGGEQRRRGAGDLFLCGPGLPHWAKVIRYPFVYIVVYFQPSVLTGIDAGSDGARILRRFTAPQSLRQRMPHPSPAVRRHLVHAFRAMIDESHAEAFGRDLRLLARLMDMLVDFIRWEPLTRTNTVPEMTVNWRQVENALQYLRANFAESVYGRQVAAAAGLSESRLQVAFREALGMPWSQYLRGFRVHRAAALLAAGRHNVTEAAMAVGFQSVSHFDATFRAFMGISPREYLKRLADSR